MHTADIGDQQALLLDIATRNTICASSTDTLGAVASIMAQKRISSIVVVDSTVHPHPIGIVTEHNILRAMQAGCSADHTLAEIMSTPVITVPESIRCMEAYQLCLSKGIRHLVIVNEANELSGVISETDFRLRLDLSALAGQRKVSTVARRTTVAMPPTASLQQALDLMLSQRMTCVVVVKDEMPIGIVTERDIVRLYAQHSDEREMQLGQVMAAPLLTLTENEPTSRAAELMLTHKLRHMVVVDSLGRMVGVVTEHDLTKSMNQDIPIVRDEMDTYFLATLINTLPDLVWLKDVDGIYIACNRRFVDFVGLRHGDIVGKTDFDIMEKEQADLYRRYDLKALEIDGPSLNEEWITFAIDGHRERVETIKTPMRGRSGKLIGVLGIARDITQRERAETALRDSETKYRALFESAGDGIYLQDLNGLIDCNENGARIFGLARQDLVGRMPSELAPFFQANGRTSSDLEKELIASALHGKSQTFEWCAKRADGILVDLEISLNPVQYQGKACVQANVRDITERKYVEQQLRQQMRFSDAVIASLPGIFYILNPQGKFLQVNSAFYTVTGYTAAELPSLSMLDLFDGIHRQIITKRIAAVFETGSSWAEADIRKKDGSKLPYYFSGRLAQFDNQPYLVGLGIDITERRQAEANLQITASVFHNSNDGILITDHDNCIVDVNPAFTRITGYQKEEVLGLNPKILQSGRHDSQHYSRMWSEVTETNSWRGEIWNRRKCGEVYAELLSISVIRGNDGSVIRHVGVFSDISHIKAHEEKLARIAHHDSLTGLPNRSLLPDRLRQAINHSKRHGGIVAVCYLDLDGFKYINDTFGHTVGDHVLMEVANRLTRVVRSGDTVARLGGDEFVVLLQGSQREEECHTTLQRLLAVVADPMIIEGNEIMVGTSIGVCIYPTIEADGETLLSYADQAMYVAKRSGKNQFHIWNSRDPTAD
jgi:diguanylate cyclase (GGDEF)-like protein/PAS domain S-box-containing protein